MGMISVLHTWGQQRWLHPHVHCIIPGGGITKAGYWRFTASKGKFLFPSKIISSVFRGKFMEMLKAFCSKENIPLNKDFINIQGKLKEIDSWVRNRLRYCIWEDWKKPDRRKSNLPRLGINHQQAYAWSRTRMGGWAVAQSPIMVTTITLERLRKRGYESLLSYYEKVSPQLNEPLYTRSVRTVV